MTVREKEYLKDVLEKNCAYNGFRILEELEKENAELKATVKLNASIANSFQQKICILEKENEKLRDSLRKYEVVPDVYYLPNGSEVYKENVGDNPYDIK